MDSFDGFLIYSKENEEVYCDNERLDHDLKEPSCWMDFWADWERKVIAFERMWESWEI